jgi:hypothetical protein
MNLELVECGTTSELVRTHVHGTAHPLLMFEKRVNIYIGTDLK